MSAWLGLDCGGTKSQWAWWPEASRPGGLGGSVQPASKGLAAAVRDLLMVLRAADPAGAATAVVAAIAGAGDGAVRAELTAALQAGGIRTPLAIVGDVLAAAAGTLTDGPGVLVWSGTGSFAIARSAAGALHRTGGRGHLLGDQGSAYDLVRRAAAAAVLAADGLGPPTRLCDELVRAFSAPNVERLGAVLQQQAPGAVAAQLPAVLACAARGDAVADQVLDDGMEALAMVANAALRAAGLAWTGLPLVFGGGLLHGSEALCERLQQRLAALGAKPAQLADADAAARGAARLACDWHQRREPLCRWVDHGSV